LLYGMSMPGGLWSVVLVVAAQAAVIAGCGGDDGPTTEPERTQPETTQAQPEQPSGRGVALRKIGEFDQPLYVTQTPGSGDLYVVEQTGTVRLVRGGRVASEPFLEIGDMVTVGPQPLGEQGLLSLAFAPDFEDSRLLYVYFTDSGEDQRIVEFRANSDGTGVQRGSRRDVLRMDDFASNHNGGLLLFGADGHLYIGTGDGGGAGDPERNGQDLSSLLGKILRIDPRSSGGRPYGIPEENPFVRRPGARPEIFAYGLRNPWRFDFDPETGSMVIADVGQNEFEEIDYLPVAEASGANFGWSAFEGNARFNLDQEAPGAVRPIFAYGRNRGCSITGGYVVRDPSLPSLAGRYVYGDYCEPELRSLMPAVGKARDDRPLGLRVSGLSSFGEDSAGHIYATSREGPVYRLVPE
jgi:glucose/arabinose dehydrogenase